MVCVFCYIVMKAFCVTKNRTVELLYFDTEYDGNGCWSGTAIVKDDCLYLFYAPIRKRKDLDIFDTALL